MPAPKRNAKRKRSDVEAEAAEQPTMEELEECREDVLNKFSQSENTKIAYESYVRKGRLFLENMIKSATTSNDGVSNMRSDQPVAIGTLVRNPKFALAFGDTPNEYTPHALVLYISQKCIHEGKGIGTANGIRSAFKKFWEKIKGGKYHEKWHQHPITLEWLGNPANAVDVLDLMSALKHKQSADGTMRKHSRAMRYEHMDKIITWSESVCPVSAIEQLSKNTEGMKLSVKHLRLRAFASTAFTIWTRNEELIQLRRSDIEFNCKGPAPYFEDHFKIRLSNRKGWQRKLDNNQEDFHRNVFGIYNQADKHPMNCYYHLQVYINFIETYFYKFAPGDFIFPTLGGNGTIQRIEHISTATVQLLIDEAVDLSGIEKSSLLNFSTHCFRRGGAQYRFQEAPLGDRWAIHTIQWWGGWADKEGPDTLMRYLIDDLQAYENSHTDILSNMKQDRKKSLMSEHTLLEPATKADVHMMCNHFQQQYDNAQRHLVMLEQRLDAGILAILQRLDLNAQNRPLTEQDFNYARANMLGTFAQPAPNINLPNTPSSTLPPTTMTDMIAATLQTNAIQCSPPPTGPIPVRPLPPPPAGPRAAHSEFHVEPPAGLCVPHIPMTGRSKKHSLEDVLDHWENANSKIGLIEALKDWPRVWFTGPVNKPKFAAQRELRKVIAEEYIDHYNRDDAAFKKAYPKWDKGHSGLVKDIRHAKKIRLGKALSAAANNNTDPEYIGGVEGDEENSSSA